MSGPGGPRSHESECALEACKEVSDGSEELGVLFPHEPMAALLEDHLLGPWDGFHDLIGRIGRRDLVVAAGEDEGRGGDPGEADLTS